jgi:glycosyltransferase involved in cell wall biosynthesis
MRILFLTSEVPHPPDSGGRIKTATLLDHLSQTHDLTVVCFRRAELSDDQRRWSKGFGTFRTLPLNRGRDVATLLRSYIGGVPLSIERNRLGAMATLVEEEVARGDFEAIFADHWLMAQYVPDPFQGLRLLHEHNAEHVIWQRQADLTRNPLLKLEARRVRDYEVSVVDRFDRVFAVSEADRQALVDIGADGSRIDILPNIPDPSLLGQKAPQFDDSEQTVAYLGTLSWQPNIDGLMRFVTQVFPVVHERLPDCRLVVGGRGAPSKLVKLLNRSRGVEFIGNVTEPETVYRRARLMVEATRTGGGTKLKVLNALARGIPVVASPEAAEGLSVTDGADILIARSDVTMAESIVRLAGDRDLWRSLSEGGRKLIRELYVAGVAFRPLDEALRRSPVDG